MVATATPVQIDDTFASEPKTRCPTGVPAGTFILILPSSVGASISAPSAGLGEADGQTRKSPRCDAAQKADALPPGWRHTGRRQDRRPARLRPSPRSLSREPESTPPGILIWRFEVFPYRAGPLTLQTRVGHHSPPAPPHRLQVRATVKEPLLKTASGHCPDRGRRSVAACRVFAPLP